MTQEIHVTKNRYSYCHTLEYFMQSNEEKWLNEMHKNFLEAFDFDITAQQINAWKDCYRVLKEELAKLYQKNANFHIIFEYALPYESGRRPDVILVNDKYVLILEFKKKKGILRSDCDQAMAYGRDIQEYHFASRNKIVLTYLVITEMDTYHNEFIKGEFYICSGDRLGNSLIENTTSSSSSENIFDWINSRYEPLPTIVEAARKIMLNEALPQIRKVNSTCIPSAIQRLKEAVIDAKTHSKHILAFVTGIPGSGKTFLGLQFAHSIKDEKKSINSVYLSGNGPLIKVIKDSLKNDSFIKNLHNITYEFNFSGAKDFSSNVIVFDEAQRAWDRNKNSQKNV